MGKFSRKKGKRFELEIAKRLRAAGYSGARRTVQYCGKSPDSADVIGVPGMHFECKHQEKMHLYDWIEQAVSDSGSSGEMPVVVHKQNGKPILASLRFEDFIKLISENHHGQLDYFDLDNADDEAEYVSSVLPAIVAELFSDSTGETVCQISPDLPR